MKSKVEKESKGNWGSFGGSTHMHSFNGSGDQTPGQSSQEGKGGRRDQKAPTGDKHGFYSSGASNKDFAGTKEPGCSGPTKTGGDEKFASGGSTRMWGKGSSRLAIGGQSSQS